jgi:hypothetical protein
VIFALAWTLRIALALVLGHYKAPAHVVEPGLIARSLAAGQGFSNPFGCVTGPTSHTAPVFPYILSLFDRALSPGSTRELAIFIFSATIASLTYALLPWLAARLQLNVRIGIFAGLLGAALPLFYWVEVESEWEAPLSALFLVIALGMFAGLFSQINIRKTLATGILCGAALLTTPTLLFMFVALFLMLMWHSRHHITPAAFLGLTAAMWLPVVLFLAPWTIRNYVVFHQLIPIRGSTGLLLSVSFNDRALATYDEAAANGAFSEYPLSTPRICVEFAKYGETFMNQLYEQRALDWMRANPGRTAQLVIGHFVAFWRLAVPSPVKTLASELLTLLAIPGLWFCFRKYRFAAQLLGVVLLTYPIAYYIGVFDSRYRYPLHPLILLLACVFLNEMARMLSAKSPEPSNS